MAKVFTIDSDNHFNLAPSFLATYQNTQPKWGPVGYVTYKRTYARPILNENGDVIRTEEFWETLQRVVEGVYTMQKHHIRSSRRRWDEARAQASAQIMYRKMWDFKFLPPGRGLWAWHLPLLENKGGGALNNCAFVSTENLDIDFAEPFCFLMDFSMLGVGVGFDTEGAGKVSLVKAPVTTDPYVVEDTREGWIDLIRTILNAFVGKAKLPVYYKKLPNVLGIGAGTYCGINIDVSKVRPEGTSIKGFGGTASGPEPLVELAKALIDLLHKRASSDTPQLTSTDIVDIMNLIGKCVVAGNVRRSSEIAIGNREDKEFLKLKDPTESFDLQKKMKRHASQNKQWKQYEEDITSLKKSIQQYGVLDPQSLEFQKQISELESLQKDILKDDPDYRQLYKEFKALPLNNHRWASNNTVDFPLGSGYERVGKQIATNGEPGISWMEVIRKYGRLSDPPNDKDRRAKGFNPCSEQTLESYELCCLVETFPTNHANLTEYLDTLKYAYLYAKTVTLIPTHYEQTNEVISRNRRIGTSMAGVAELYCNLGMQEMIRWFDKGYQRICELDKQYSEWLGIPESNKKTSMKPGGTIPLLVGKEGGQRFSESEFYFRTIRCDRTSKLVEMFEQAGYRVEDDIYTPRSKVIYFPIQDTASKRFAADISIWEQVMLMSAIQAYWSDNQVSATIMFKPEEAKDIPLILSAFEGKLKTISFLPLEDHGYLQAPYIKCTKEQYESYASSLKEPDWSTINNTHEAEDKFCEGDKCLIPLKK